MFAQEFQNRYGIGLMESSLRILYERNNRFVSFRCLNYCLKLISTCVKSPVTKSAVEAHIPKILYEYAITVTYVTEQDLILYRDDPQEYIRKSTDFTETFATPRNSMLDLVVHIMDKDKPRAGERGETPRPQFLNDFLQYIVKNMTEYSQLEG